MDKKTVGFIATIGTVLLCTCPSFVLCAFGLFALSGAALDRVLNGPSEPIPPDLAIVLISLSLISLAIPIIVGFFTTLIGI